MKGYNVEKQCRILEELRNNSNAVIINPINAPEIAEILDELINSGVFVVAVNNDISGKNRHCCVENNYFYIGEWHVHLLKRTKKEAKI